MASKKATKVEPIAPGSRELAGRREKQRIPLQEVQFHQALPLNGIAAVVNRSLHRNLHFLDYIPEDNVVSFSTPTHGEIDVPVTSVSFMRRAPKVCEQA